MIRKYIRIILLISLALTIPHTLLSQNYYNTYGYIDRNLRQETFIDDTERNVSIKIYKDADQIGTERIISGLDNYNKRMELYRDVIMNLVTQPKCQSVDLIYEDAKQGVTKEELLAQAAILYEAGSFSTKLLDYICKTANLAYIPGSNQTAQLVNSWKHIMRQVNQSNLHNVSNALGAISVVMNTIEMGDKVAIISSNYVLLKALEMDLAKERLRLLREYCDIEDDAFTEALALVTNDMNTLPQSDWNKIIMTLHSQGKEVEKLIITMGQSVNTLGSLLANMPKPSPLTGWIYAGLFTWQTGVMIQEHKDHMRTSSLAATIYANMKFPEQPSKIFELSEYAQYLFVDEFRLAFDNWVTLVLSWFNQSWYEVRQAWEDESNYLIEHIQMRRVKEAINLFDINEEENQEIINITNPNSQTIWYQDEDIDIEWNNATGNQIIVMIFKDNVELGICHDWTANDNICNGWVNPDWGTGNNFRLKVIDENDNYGWSEEFTIQSGNGLHDNFYSWNISYWEGNWWSHNINHGAWQPTVENGYAYMKTTDYSWGQIRTTQMWSPGQTFSITLIPFLESGGINADKAFFCLSSNWVFYDTDIAAGIKLDNRNVIAWCEDNFEIAIFGSYTPGDEITLTITWNTDGTLTLTGGSGSYTMASSLLQANEAYFVIVNKDSIDGIEVDQVIICE